MAELDAIEKLHLELGDYAKHGVDFLLGYGD